jgi:hypothetical protein
MEAFTCIEEAVNEGEAVGGKGFTKRIGSVQEQ